MIGIICFNVFSTGIQYCVECWDHLISGPRGIPDSQLSASSTHNNGGNLHDPKYGRLHFYSGGTKPAAAWSARTNNDQQFIEVSSDILFCFDYSSCFIDDVNTHCKVTSLSMTVGAIISY